MTLLEYHRLDRIKTGWEAVKQKGIADFKELFTPNILFFCEQSGTGERTYSEIIEGLRMDGGRPLKNSTQTTKNVMADEEQRLSYGLFGYLCSS
jgi:hypothetical protein